MKGLFVVFIALLALLFFPVIATGQTDETVATNPAVEQPLVREGTFAAALAEALELGIVMDEAQAESILLEAGIEPKNGWIADYPVTPEIIGDLQNAVVLAAESGKLRMGKEDALSALQEVADKYGLSVAEGEPEGGSVVTEAPSYPDSSELSDYYYGAGPPVVTYFAPPPAYEYLYDWVPYPFWGYNYWFPGYFVLIDFDKTVVVHGHRHHFSNHVFDHKTRRYSRVSPARAFRHGWHTGKSFRGAERRGGRNVARGMNEILHSRKGFSGRDRYVSGSPVGGHNTNEGSAFMSHSGRSVTRGQTQTQSSVRHRLENRIRQQSTSMGAAPHVSNPKAYSRSFENRAAFSAPRSSRSWTGGSSFGGFSGSSKSYSRPSAGKAFGGASHWEGGSSFGGFRGSSGGRFRR